ncbi:carboxymuconolactone decarboxylase family protein [Enterovirga aerilata]|uniref:Carboxymuconolactone decarboxylase family protein n=1 Tax=Enterovirga aerilata TaxID=2730920 RepID=A0A849I4G5_9HYPH|nr:carboxymuconolactone decarboxylase family protein [Enterovirga sp. DB1703]NNM70957.1 carboxymuconolactone decarboxylase family protein [Enterovirga sp. DB1703]
MPRLPDIEPDRLTPEQRRVYDAILSGPRGVVQGPLRVWVNSPGLADKAQALGAFCRYGTSLPQRLSELAIITTGAHWQAGFEWAVHAPIAQEAGIDIEAIEAIRTGREPDLPRADERAVYMFSSEILRTRRVSDETFRFALETLGQVGLVDLVGVLGYYGLISMTINAFEVPLPDGVADPFPARSG